MNTLVYLASLEILFCSLLPDSKILLLSQQPHFVLFDFLVVRPDKTKYSLRSCLVFFWATKSPVEIQPGFQKLGYKDSNLEMTESESVALPFGDSPSQRN
jgi:hypothetical protein